MLRALLGTVLLAASAIPLTAAPPPARPKGPPPTVMVAEVDPVKGPYIVRRVFEYRTEKRLIEVQVNGQKQVREQQVSVPVMVEFRVGLADKQVRVFDAAGKRVAAKDLAKLLKQPTAVLVSTDGREVDPFYLRLAREGTLVVVAPGVATGPVPAKEMPKEVPAPK